MIKGRGGNISLGNAGKGQQWPLLETDEDGGLTVTVVTHPEQFVIAGMWQLPRG